MLMQLMLSRFYLSSLLGTGMWRQQSKQSLLFLAVLIASSSEEPGRSQDKLSDSDPTATCSSRGDMP